LFYLHLLLDSSLLTASGTGVTTTSMSRMGIVGLVTSRRTNAVDSNWHWNHWCCDQGDIPSVQAKYSMVHDRVKSLLIVILPVDVVMP
jgi:hypothetical protein